MIYSITHTCTCTCNPWSILYEYVPFSPCSATHLTVDEWPDNTCWQSPQSARHTWQHNKVKVNYKAEFTILYVQVHGDSFQYKIASPRSYNIITNDKIIQSNFSIHNTSTCTCIWFHTRVQCACKTACYKSNYFVI